MTTQASWQTRELKLPPWARVLSDASPAVAGKVSVVIEIDPDGFVPEWRDLLSAPSTLDQYWLECVWQCAKMDVQGALQGTQYQPSVSGKPVEIRVVNRPSYALRNYSEGAGAAAATGGVRVVATGSEPPRAGVRVPTARAHYQRVRGAVPTL
jgi:hypothetical protein